MCGASFNDSDGAWALRSFLVSRLAFFIVLRATVSSEWWMVHTLWLREGRHWTWREAAAAGTLTLQYVGATVEYLAFFFYLLANARGLGGLRVASEKSCRYRLDSRPIVAV